MTAIIQTEQLTKSYGPHRGIIDVDLTVEQGEVFGFLGPERGRQDHDDPDLLDLIRPTSGRALVFGIETSADPVAIHRRVGYIPGEFALYDRLTGGQTIRLLRQPARRRRPGLPGAPDRPLRARPVAALQGVLEGQQAEGRARHRPPAPARAADPRRADLGSRPARPADVLRAPPRGEGRGPHRLPVEPHPVRGREDLRPRRDHPRGPARQGRPRRGAPRPGPPPGRAAVRRPGAGRRVRSPARA